jgi:hypothetical protein
MESGTIISWEKKEGDKLNEGNELIEFIYYKLALHNQTKYKLICSNTIK